MTRRDVLKRSAGVAVLGAGAVPAGARAAKARRKRERVAVIGAGAGGVAAAYFLAGSCDVDVFEARDRIGGHADSRVVTDGGHAVTVDLGAQFFHPATHPLYVALLAELGLDAQTHASPGSLCVFARGGGAPRFTSTRPLDTLPTSAAFATFTQLARTAATSLAWETTVPRWIAGLDLDAAFTRDVLSPWIASLIGCSHADAQHVSARSILSTFALAFPADPAGGAMTYTSRIGLQGNLRQILRHAPAARVHLGAPARSLARGRDGWILRTPSGSHGPYDHVVLNAPPRVSRRLLGPLKAYKDVTELVDAYTYFDSRLVIHRDPAYVAAARADWTAYNAEVDGAECEGSAWLGALHAPLPSGAPVGLFKSWARRRHADPRAILLQRRFQHPLIDRRALAAARALRAHQGRGGLHFSGAYTTGSDLQETAVYSALKVAEAIAPRSATLTALRARMTAAGLGDLSYDL
jgi:predicted NAD/FAD-binding protein